MSIWADEIDKKIFKDFSDINWFKAGYHPKSQPIGYWYARVRQKFWQLVYKMVGDQFDAAVKSLVLYSQELTSVALCQNADLYIGHNLGALPAITKASLKFKAKSIFDFEDFHRGEFGSTSPNTQMIFNVENRYIPLITSITAASPAITHAYSLIFPSHLCITINNCFPLEYAIQDIRSIPQQPLKLFWFSQYVGKQRGLETVLEAMSYFRKDQIILTLLGSASSNIKQYFISLLKIYNLSVEQLVFLDPVSEEQIVSIASMHHVGLVSEFAHNQNRDLCLTNKLFMYLLAGNALIVSDTLAQKSFLADNPGIGSLYEQENQLNLSFVFKNYINDPLLLNNHRKKSLQLGKTKYNWNVEEKHFLQNVETILAS